MSTKDKDYFGQMWGNKLYIMRYKMKPEKITFNPYKNEYEKLAEKVKKQSLTFIILFTSGMVFGLLVSILINYLTS
jgi:hypothetical protein